MKKVINLPPYFVIRTDENMNIIETIAVDPVMPNANDIANDGIGCMNYIVGTLDIIDRLSPPPEDIANQAMEMLKKIINGRRHSSSPQCLPVADFRALSKLVTDYERAQAANGEQV